MMTVETDFVYSGISACLLYAAVAALVPRIGVRALEPKASSCWWGVIAKLPSAFDQHCAIVFMLFSHCIPHSRKLHVQFVTATYEGRLNALDRGIAPAPPRVRW